MGPGLEMKIFMSDDAPQYWDAWRMAFDDSIAPDARKLLCTWHVLKNWRLAIKSKLQSQEHQIWAWHRLNVLLHASDESQFRKLLSCFLTELEEIAGENGELLEYFRKHYCQHESRIRQWAMWARRGSIVNTNMFLESFHKILKFKFLNGRQNRRMDTLLYTLLHVARWYLQEYAVIREKGVPASSHRLAALHRRHKTSLQLQEADVRRDGDTWYVKSMTEEGLEYELQEISSECHCLLKCRHKLCGVCPHRYFCSCPDAVLSHTACKHMHLLQRLSAVTQQTEIAQENCPPSHDEPTDDIAPDPLPHLRLTNKQTKQNVSETRNILLDCLRMLSLNNNPTVLASVQGKAREIQATLKANLTGVSCAPTISNVGPANKLIENQRRFEPSRRSKRGRGPSAFLKPTRSQTAAIIGKMNEETPQFCAMCFSHDDNAQSSDDVDWTMCEFCKAWFHSQCCDIMEEYELIDDDFKCVSCCKKQA